MSSVKIPSTQYPVLELIKNRWSARAFTDTPLTDETVHTLFEAASWAASANNEQPWQYIYAHRGTPGFDQLWNCLMPGNQPWAKNAAILILSVARKTYAANGNPNAYSWHDLGMANATLFLQATAMDIYGHPMAGFSKDKAKEALGLTDDQEPVCMIALGYLAAPEVLEEPFLTREVTARTRKALSEIVTAI